MDKALLTVESLSISFKHQKAYNRVVEELSFVIKKGKTLGIVGESGSGKSVTALALMGLIQSSGRVDPSSKLLWHASEDEQMDLLQLSERERRSMRGKHISMIFQEPMTSLNPVHRCGPQILEAIRVHQRISKKAAKEKVRNLFDEVELPAKTYNAYPHEISGGQKQRVMIAMAICNEPELLIADEPTTALDVTVQATVIDLLKRLQQKKNISLIFITHDLGVVAEIADELLVMRRGERIEYGDILSLFEQPSHPYTKGLLACRPSLDTNAERLLTVEDFLVDEKRDSTGKKLEISEKKEKDTAIAHEPLLKTKSLSTWFSLQGNQKKNPHYLKAVDKVDIHILPSETVGLVGESGCGKTTLGRTILRLVNANSGEVLFDGQDLLRLSKKELRVKRKDIQIIFQDPYSALNPRQKVGQAILEPMKVHHMYANDEERKEVVFQLLEKVGLERQHFSRYPHEFSGGQRQRVCIARALALKPSLIICDESVAALDVSVQAQVLNLLKDLQQEYGLSYLFISHDLSVVKFMSARIYVMKEGKIVEEGPSGKLYDSPEEAYTKTLLSAIPDGSVARIKELKERRKD